MSTASSDFQSVAPNPSPLKQSVVSVKHRSMGSLPPEIEADSPEIYKSLGLIRSGKAVEETPRVLSVISTVLERSVERNEKLLEAMESKGEVTIFHGLRAPDLGIGQYIERIFKYAKCSPSCFILACMYINTYLGQPNNYLTSLNVHRLLITSVVVAAKFIDDAFFNNAYYAKVGGVSTKEMNSLELIFLFSLDFRIQVTVENFRRFCLQVQKEFMAGGSQIERPIQVCGLKRWTSKEEPTSQQQQGRYTCGAV